MNTFYNSVSVLSNCYDPCVSLQISNIKLESIHWAQGRWCETQPPLNWKRINNFGCTLIRVSSLNNTSFYRKSNGQFAPCCLIDIIWAAFNKILIRLKCIKINGFFFPWKEAHQSTWITSIISIFWYIRNWYLRLHVYENM